MITGPPVIGPSRAARGTELHTAKPGHPTVTVVEACMVVIRPALLGPARHMSTTNQN